MKQLLLISLLFLFFNTGFSQQKAVLQFSDEPFEKVVLSLEKSYNVKYSYVDSILVEKRISLPKKEYTLEELNLEIEKQTHLKTVKISERYYSIIEKDLVYTLDAVLIESYLVPSIKKYNQKFIVTPNKKGLLAGVTDSDVLLSLQQLPGVKSPNETATGLHVRGGTPDQNLILLDGIRLFHPGHLFGMISGINPSIVKTVHFYYKAVAPKYGERISGVIDIETPSDFVVKPKASIGVNSLNIDAFLQAPIVKNKLDIQISGRKSFTEFLQLYTFNQLSNKVFQNTDFKSFDTKNKFQFYDYSAKILYKLSDKSMVCFTGLSINNNLNYFNRIANDSISNNEMKIVTSGYSINWDKKYSRTFSHQFLAYYSLYDFDYLKKQDYLETGNFEAFKKLNRVINSGVEFHFSSIISKNKTLDFGYQISGNDVSHLFTTFTQDVGIDLSLKRLYSISHSGYLNYIYKTEKLTIQSGFRYSYLTKINSQALEPRFFLQKKITESLIFQFSFERKSQFIAQIRENAANDLSLENYIWVLADTKKYPIQKATHFSGGMIYKFESWLLDIDTYYKFIDGITRFNFGFFNQNNEVGGDGKGFVKGVDVFLQKKSKNWQMSATYSFLDSKNKFEDLNNNIYFKSSANSCHSLHMSLNRTWNKFSATVAWVWNSGKPYSVINENGTIESLNENNLSSYHRLDASFEYNFSKKNTHFKTGFSMYNIYDRKSILNREYERKYSSFSDFSNPRYEKQDFYSLGFTPNIFFRISI
jgi:outer membrane cobalamin receptor